MSYTLAELRTQVREAADAEGDLHVTDSELTTYINQGGQALHDLVTAANEDYYLDSIDFTLDAASGNAFTIDTWAMSSLQPRFYKLRGIDYRDGDRWLKVSPYNFAEREKYRDDSYEGSYRLWYLPKFWALRDDTDELDEQWSEYVVTYAARKCLRKEESDTSDADRDLATLTQRITSMTQKRDAGGPRHVAEVRRNMHDDWRDDVAYETDNASGLAYRLQGTSILIVSRGWGRR